MDCKIYGYLIAVIVRTWQARRAVIGVQAFQSKLDVDMAPKKSFHELLIEAAADDKREGVKRRVNPSLIYSP